MQAISAELQVPFSTVYALACQRCGGPNALERDMRLLIAAAAALGMAACTPAEQTESEQTAAEAGQELEQAGEAVGDAAQAAGEAAEDATNEAAGAVERATDDNESTQP